MEPTEATNGRKPFWTKWKIGGLFSILLAAVAGFASPEVRKATCLELPTPADLVYPRDNGTLLLDSLDTNTEQKQLNGKHVRFQARVYGETPMQMFYAAYLDPDSVKNHVAANIRPLDYEDAGTPFGGSELSQPPPIAVIVADSLASELARLPPGSVVEFEGEAKYLSKAQPNSMAAEMARKNPAGSETIMTPPSWGDFYVMVTGLTAVEPSNAPRNRMLCRVFHDIHE